MDRFQRGMIGAVDAVVSKWVGEPTLETRCKVGLTLAALSLAAYVALGVICYAKKNGFEIKTD